MWMSQYADDLKRVLLRRNHHMQDMILVHSLRRSFSYASLCSIGTIELGKPLVHPQQIMFTQQHVS
jgi:hypothetical protein